jgi:hypothetical protein
MSRTTAASSAVVVVSGDERSSVNLGFKSRYIMMAPDGA